MSPRKRQQPQQPKLPGGAEEPPRDIDYGPGEEAWAEQENHSENGEPVARLDDATQCHDPKNEHRGLWPLQLTTDVSFLVDGKPIIRVSDYAKDGGGESIVVEGAATFTVCGLPVARAKDKLNHPGVILQGSPNFWIGGPTWKLPPQIKVEGEHPYTAYAYRDLYLISTTRTGQALFRKIDQNNRKITIKVSTEATNDATGTGEAQGSDGTIHYNPFGEVAGRARTGAVPELKGWGPDTVPECPQTNLAHELIHTAHAGNPDVPRPRGGVITPLGELSDHEAELLDEYYAIRHDPPSKEVADAKAKWESYLASRNKQPPEEEISENGIRVELGLEQRSSHDMVPMEPKEVRFENKRPGMCR